MTLPITRKAEPPHRLQTACEMILDIVAAAWGIEAMAILDGKGSRDPTIRAARCMFAHHASEYVGSRPLTGRLVWNGSRHLVDTILLQLPRAKHHPRWQAASAIVDDAVARIP